MVNERLTIPVRRSRVFRASGFKTAPNFVLNEIAADEDKLAHSHFVVPPCPLMIALDNHVNALQNIPIRIALERDDSLQTEDIRTLHLRKFPDPGEEALRVQFAANKRHGCD